MLDSRRTLSWPEPEDSPRALSPPLLARAAAGRADREPAWVQVVGLALGLLSEGRADVALLMGDFNTFLDREGDCYAALTEAAAGARSHRPLPQHNTHTHNTTHAR